MIVGYLNYKRSSSLDGKSFCREHALKYSFPGKKAWTTGCTEEIRRVIVAVADHVYKKALGPWLTSQSILPNHNCQAPWNWVPFLDPIIKQLMLVWRNSGPANPSWFIIIFRVFRSLKMFEALLTLFLGKAHRNLPADSSPSAGVSGLRLQHRQGTNGLNGLEPALRQMSPWPKKACLGTIVWAFPACKQIDTFCDSTFLNINGYKYPLVSSYSYWKWPFRVDFPIKHADFPQLC